MDTSLAAYESVKPYTPSIREIIYNWILERGEYGATRDEIFNHFGYRMNTVTPRVRELLDEGRIIETDKFRLTTAGRKARVLVARKFK